ncbi:MAG TPA: glutathione S-transferase family protein [Steroidobacteraceae bacterium]|nr:glutathione S-transferase family protein [Steroidobacteraceae bacterium]
MMQPGDYVLWGTPHSLYTGKVRSYLIKKGVPYRDMRPSHPDFGRRIAPLIGNFVVPVVETPDGRILQDSTEIIEHIEQAVPTSPLIPDGPVQKAVSWLIGAFGSEALLPAAMHYRWSYRAEQEAFLRAEFGRSVYAGPDRAARDQAGRALMDYFNDFLPGLGITAATVPTYEAAYCEFLEALELHFQRWPYVLGGRPSIADFGLMAPLYAHLARDPVPATLMKGRAPNVYRWTERMNLAGITDGEFAGVPDSYPADDAIPESLEPALELMFRDWAPQLLADAAHYNAWVAADPSMPAGRLVSASGERKIHPSLGPIEFTWRGCRIHRASAPHGLWHFDRATAHARSLTGDARRRFDDLVRRTGGEQVMAIRLVRPMKREHYALVLA